MSKNTNTINKTSQNFGTLARQVGMMLMTAAAVTGMLELPDHNNSRVALPGQPSLVFAEENDEASNPIRREKEEGVPHYVSYSVSQRTPGRSARK